MTTVSKNTFYLVCLQLFSRIITFLLNNFILRWSFPQVIGLASIRLEVIYSAILFMGREGFRLALTRFPLNDSNSSVFVAMSRIPLYSSLFYGTCIAWFNISFPPIEFESNMLLFSSYKLTVLYFCISACMECLLEPIYIVMNISSMLGYRLTFEGLAMTLKCSFIFAGILFNHHTNSSLNDHLASDIHIIGVSQLLYTTILLICYYSFHLRMSGTKSSWPITTKQLFDFKSTVRVLIQSIHAYCSPWFNDAPVDVTSIHFPTFQLGLTLTRQSFIKQFLNQGDLIVLSSQSSLDDQAVYSVVTNYGSLIVRILLQPMEEASRLYLCTEAAKLKNADMNSATRKYLMDVLHLDAYLGLCFICFGTWFTQPLIYIMVGSKWALDSLVPISLSLYCFYIPLLAINGILETVVDAYANSKQLNSLQIWMTVSTCIYLPIAIVSTRIWGAPGMIVANMLNTILRLTYSFGFVSNVWKSKKRISERINSNKPKWPYPIISMKVLFSFVVSFMFNGISYYYHLHDMKISSYSLLHSMLYHICLGCALFLLCVLITHKYDSHLVNTMRMTCLSRVKKSNNKK